MRTTSRPHPVAIGFAILALGGCGAAAPQSPAVSAGPAASVGPVAPTAQAKQLDEAAQAWLVVGRPDEPDLQLVWATTGEIVLDIPAGAPREGWGRLITATVTGASTIVRDVAVQPGFGGPEARVPGTWQLPTVGLDPIPAGRSLDGSTIALVERGYDAEAGRSRFAIVEHEALGARSTVGDSPLRLARVIELPGAFEYDALSPDGRILYVVEHLEEAPWGSYQVRAVDVPTGVMRDAVIVDKGNPGETMAGRAIAQLRRPGGLVLTLYRGPEHPFIHALMTTEAWAVCIDLPGSADAVSDAEQDLAVDWGLAAGDESIYAVNASLGLVVDVDPATLTVRRSASIGATTSAPTGPGTAGGPGVVLAKFGHSEVGSVGRRVVLSPDGSTLFAAGADGILAIGTKGLSVSRHDLAGTAVDSLGILPDGTVLFALLPGSHEIVALDAATGRRLGTVPGGAYDRLVAVAP